MEKRSNLSSKQEAPTLVSRITLQRLVEATFLSRPNRFLATVEMGNRTLPSFVPNPGRMQDLLKPRTRVILSEVKGRDRKTRFDLIGVYHKNQIISVDSRVPNKLVYVALKNGDIEELKGFKEIMPEHAYDHSRFDFLLSDNSKLCLLEVKSCTLVEEGVALFPDAITVRGRKHAEQLAKAVMRGYRACVLFIVQRSDAMVFSPNDEVDPEFGKALREAVKKGLEVYAYFSEFVGNKIVLGRKLKVEL